MGCGGHDRRVPRRHAASAAAALLLPVHVTRGRRLDVLVMVCGVVVHAHGRPRVGAAGLQAHPRVVGRRQGDRVGRRRRRHLMVMMVVVMVLGRRHVLHLGAATVGARTWRRAVVAAHDVHPGATVYVGR